MLIIRSGYQWLILNRDELIMSGADRILYDKDIREPLFFFLEETYGKVRILEEKRTGSARAYDELFERDYNTIEQEIEDFRKERRSR